MEGSGRIAVSLIQEVVYARRDLQSLDHVPAQEREIDGRVIRGILPGFDGEIRERSRRCACRDVLQIEAGKELPLDDRHTEVELEQVSGRIGKDFACQVVLSLLEGVTDTPEQLGPYGLQFRIQF